jgi:hypothetical protein
MAATSEVATQLRSFEHDLAEAESLDGHVFRFLFTGLSARWPWY